MRKTKIIATLGPATDSPEMLRALILGGLNIVRLNMSHGRHDWIREKVKLIREICNELNMHVGILLDTQGPAIRTGDLPNKLPLKPGDIFTFTVHGEKSEDVYSVDVNYNDLVNDVHVGDTVLVDNGVIHMKVLSKEGNHLRCEVLTGGEMGSRRHINLPGVRVNLPALTEKDIADVKVGVEIGVDYVALSFCREPQDVILLRDLLKELGSEALIVSKLEDQQAIRNLDAIIAETDIVMVARGDLGVECPYEELPIIQRRVVKHCLLQMKPVIVATHMLESMIVNPLPTRAEITDVANAVYEQADCIMLSGETTVGKFPQQCIQVMDRVAERIERSGNAGYQEGIVLSTEQHKVASAAVHLAKLVGAAGICVFTRRGLFATATASLRPPCMTYALTPHVWLCQRLCIYYGVQSLRLDFPSTPNETVVMAEAELRRQNLIKSGDKLVFISDMILGDEMIQTVQLHLIK
jgi:pyruvate kinase